MLIKNNHPFVASARDMNELAKPLHQYGINYFTYTRSETNGARTYLTTHPDCLQHYTAGKYYLDGNVESTPVKYKSTCVFWSTLPKQYIYNDVARARGIDHGIFIISAHEDYCEFYGFAANKDNYRVINTYLNHMDVLTNFIFSFKEKAELLIKRCDKNKLILPFHNDPLDFLNDDLPLEMPKNLFQHTGRILTKRQMECSRLLLQGKTAKEIADSLTLSSRTVEYYFNNLKSKLQCKSKTELIIKLSGMLN